MEDPIMPWNRELFVTRLEGEICQYGQKCFKGNADRKDRSNPLNTSAVRSSFPKVTTRWNSL